MKGLTLKEDGQVVLDLDLIKPVPQEGESVIRVLRAGVCNTDLEIAKGYAGFKGTMGHEFVGIVEEIHEYSTKQLAHQQDINIQVGDRVVGEINLACEECDVCKKGGIAKRNHCSQRTVLGIIKKEGCFAEYITLPTINLFKVPEHLSDSEAAFAEPLAAAFRIAEQIDFKSSDNVALIGDGKLGLMIAEVLAQQNVNRIVLFGRHDEKMSLAPEKVRKVLVKDAGVAGKYENCFDICIDACGNPAGLKMAGVMTRPLGRIILKTTCADEKSVFNTSIFVVKEHLLIGSRCGNFPMALEAMGTGKIKVGKYVSGCYSLDEGVEAMKAAAVKGTLKVQIVMADR